MRPSALALRTENKTETAIIKVLVKIFKQKLHTRSCLISALFKSLILYTLACILILADLTVHRVGRHIN